MRHMSLGVIGILGLLLGLPSMAEPFRVMTLNGAQLPFPIGMGDREERAKELALTVLGLPVLPDVICLQEIFTTAAFEKLEKKLKEAYPYQAHDKSDVTIGVNSGLVVFSRYPIVQIFQHTYSQYRGIENFAAKGVLGVSLRYKKQSVLVFTTHLQTGGKWPLLDPIDQDKPNSDEIKLAQVQEAHDFIEGIAAQYADAPVFFTGDFNIKSRSDLYPGMTKIMSNWRDAHSESCSLVSGTTWGDEQDGTKGNRIDYIWVRSDKIQGNACITTAFNRKITDHLAVIGDFTSK